MKSFMNGSQQNLISLKSSSEEKKKHLARDRLFQMFILKFKKINPKINLTRQIFG